MSFYFCFSITSYVLGYPVGGIRLFKKFQFKTNFPRSALARVSASSTRRLCEVKPVWFLCLCLAVLSERLH